MPEYILGFGTNLGDRAGNLARGVALLRAAGASLLHASSLYETPPWGVEDQPAFLNAVAVVAIDRDPFALLRLVKEVEATAGREPGERWGPRILDIDILYAGEAVIDAPALQVPHVRIPERAFVLVPLAEVAPDLVDPRTGASVREMVAARDDTAGVVRISGPEWATA